MAGQDRDETSLARGNRLLAEGDVEGAVQALQEALKASPSADAHEALARAHIKAGRHLEAAEAALKALTLEPGQAKAYLRRGIALFHLDEFEGALEAFQKGKELRPTLAAFDTWTRKCRAEIDGEVEEVPQPSSPPRAGPKITIIPPKAAAASPPPTQAAAARAGEASTSAAGGGAAATQQQKQQQQQEERRKQQAAEPIAAVSGVPLPNQIRHQWYQLADRVVVDVYAKGLPKERFAAEFGERRLRLAVLPAAGVGAAGGGAAAAAEAAGAEATPAAAAAGGQPAPEWELDVELFGRVLPEACGFEVLRTKVEVTLTKADAGRAWPTLERSDAPVLPAAPMPAAPAAASSSGGASAGPPRQYPTSHVKGPKDWSAVEAEVTEMEAKGELDDGNPLNSFFQKVFSQGDEDTRRAMMKSFVESNGTVLSTNWADVGAKKVECTPPEGMEVHKWDE